MNYRSLVRLIERISKNRPKNGLLEIRIVLSIIVRISPFLPSARPSEDKSYKFPAQECEYDWEKYQKQTDKSDKEENPCIRHVASGESISIFEIGSKLPVYIVNSVTESNEDDHCESNPHMPQSLINRVMLVGIPQYTKRKIRMSFSIFNNAPHSDFMVKRCPLFLHFRCPPIMAIEQNSLSFDSFLDTNSHKNCKYHKNKGDYPIKKPDNISSGLISNIFSYPKDSPNEHQDAKKGDKKAKEYFQKGNSPICPSPHLQILWHF